MLHGTHSIYVVESSNPVVCTHFRSGGANVHVILEAKRVARVAHWNAMGTHALVNDMYLF